MSERVVLLRNWFISNSRLEGIAYGHPDFDDGTYIRTSRIMRSNNGLVITVHGTRYILLPNEHDLTELSKDVITTVMGEP